MTIPLWNDEEFRSFLFTMRHGIFGPMPEEFTFERFIDQARLRIAPEVQRRVLAEVGAATDASGIARAALAVLEDEAFGQRRTWLLVSPDPWSVLVDLVTREIRSSYRATVRTRADRRALEGIRAASSRSELSAGEADGLDDGDEMDAATTAREDGRASPQG